MKNLAYQLLLPTFLTLAAVQSISLLREDMKWWPAEQVGFCSKHIFRTRFHFPVSDSRLDAFPLSGLSHFELLCFAAMSAVSTRCVLGLGLKLMANVLKHCKSRRQAKCLSPTDRRFFLQWKGLHPYCCERKAVKRKSSKWMAHNLLPQAMVKLS